MVKRTWEEAANPKTGGGDSRILQLGDSTKIRLLEPSFEEWRQHTIEAADGSDKRAFVVCPRGAEGRDPNPCPLCMKSTDEKGNQRFNVARRRAINVWDYESESVKILVGGPQIFDEFASTHKSGMDPQDSDYVIIKTGKGLGTKYKMVRKDQSPFEINIDESDLHDVAQLAEPPSIEAIFKDLDDMGWDFDSLGDPEFTLEEAEAFVLPYGKYKNDTVESVVAEDTRYAQYIHDAKRDDGMLGDPVFVALHVVLLDRGLTPPIPDVDGPAASGRSESAKAKAAVRKAAKEDPDPEPEPTPAEEPENSTKASDEPPEEIQINLAGMVIDAPRDKVKEMLAKGAELVNDDDLKWVNIPDPEPDESNLDPKLIAKGDDGKWHHPALGRGYATKGAATQALNRIAPQDDDPEPEPDTADGDPEDEDALRERIRELINSDPELTSDVEKLINLLESAGGKRNIAEFSLGELKALEAKLTE